jgi:hypothetical protein
MPMEKQISTFFTTIYYSLILAGIGGAVVGGLFLNQGWGYFGLLGFGFVGIGLAALVNSDSHD